MTEVRLDPYQGRYARRARGMTASEIRALFAVATRPEIVSLAGGMPYTAALDRDAVADVTTAVLRDSGPVALQYGGGQGVAALRERLVDVMAAEHLEVAPDDLVVTNGGQQALDLLSRLFCNPGDIVLAEGPAYVGALGAFSSYQGHVIHVDMDAHGLIPEALDETMAALQHAGRTAKFLYTVPNHQNPAGVSLSRARRDALIERAERYDLLLIEDNPYGLLDFKGEQLPCLHTMAPERVVYLGTLSKIFSPGIRIGWAVAPAPIRAKLTLLKETADLSQSNLTQYVAERWLATQPWLEQVEEFRELYRERCDAMLDELSRHLSDICTWSVPTGGFFVWLRLPDGMDSKQLLPSALQARVAYVPGRAFYADGSGDSEMRLSFCFPPSEQIREGVRRLARVIRDQAALRAAMYDATAQQERTP
ncbi:MAG: PLP-dependent aminotransferase family protein [Actinobacteria bacterium]|nr:PLP-dependent aminotransferase family protein [Actinomycetota bacterium]